MGYEDRGAVFIVWDDPASGGLDSVVAAYMTEEELCIALSLMGERIKRVWPLIP
jgi:hypothetical protein